MGATYGDKIKMTIFGESHGKAIGLVIDGLKPGLAIDEEFIKSEMARRAPGRNALSTQRKETDAFEIVSGIFNGRATGAPLCAMIRNSGQHSSDYGELRTKMRPGHSDYAGYVRYNGFNDYRGGGHFSGRLTAPLVFMGAVAKLALKDQGIFIGAHIARIGKVKDALFNPMGEGPELFEELKQQTLPTLSPKTAEEMNEEILAAKNDADSIGGVIECMAVGMKAGIGNPFFDSVESRLSHALFSVPAVKGVEFGAGFGFCEMRGSEANDPMRYENGKVVTAKNNNGGITGGITNGMPIIFRVAVKPTASIYKEQETVDVENKCNTTLTVKGRHDPCIVQRAVPVIEAAAAWTLCDLLS